MKSDARIGPEKSLKEKLKELSSKLDKGSKEKKGNILEMEEGEKIKNVKIQ
jgi:hypothetical protein